MSFLIQSGSLSDYDDLVELTSKTDLINLPSDEKLLKQKLKISELSFKGELTKAQRHFLFVMRDTNGKLIGTSQMQAKLGTKNEPLYFLEQKQEKSSDFCQLQTSTDGPSHLGGIILTDSYRGHPHQLGKQLSLICFLFVAMHPEYFEDILHAELDPAKDSHGKRPFFDYFIYNYIKYSVAESNYLTLTDKKKLFAKYPKGKILLSSLPSSIRSQMGRAGFYSQRLLSLLKKQGFYSTNTMDPLDAGPYVQAKTQNVFVIQNTQKIMIDSNPNTKNTYIKPWLWGQENNNRFTGGLLQGSLQNNQLSLTNEYKQISGLNKKEPLFVSHFPLTQVKK